MRPALEYWKTTNWIQLLLQRETTVAGVKNSARMVVTLTQKQRDKEPTGDKEKVRASPFFLLLPAASL